MRSNIEPQIDNANHYPRSVSQKLYFTNAIAISSLAEVNTLALTMGIACVGHNPDTDVHCKTLTMGYFIQAMNNVHPCNVCTQKATSTLSMIQFRWI